MDNTIDESNLCKKKIDFSECSILYGIYNKEKKLMEKNTPIEDKQSNEKLQEIVAKFIKENPNAGISFSFCQGFIEASKEQVTNEEEWKIKFNDLDKLSDIIEEDRDKYKQMYWDLQKSNEDKLQKAIVEIAAFKATIKTYNELNARLCNDVISEKEKIVKAIDWCDERCENIHMVGNFSSFTIGEKHGIEMVKQYLQSLNQINYVEENEI